MGDQEPEKKEMTAVTKDTPSIKEKPVVSAEVAPNEPSEKEKTKPGKGRAKRSSKQEEKNTAGANAVTATHTIKKRKRPEPVTGEREKELDRIHSRAKRDPRITESFLTQTLNLLKAKEKKIAKIGKLRDAMEATDAKRIERAKTDKERAKAEVTAENNRTRMAKIETELADDKTLVLHYSDEEFLNKLRLPRDATPYMRFSQSIRPEIRKENQAATFVDISRSIGAAWQKLTAEEKTSWKDTSVSAMTS